MTKKREDPEVVSVEREEVPGLGEGQTFQAVSISKGVVNLSQFYLTIDPEKPIDPKQIVRGLGLGWQKFTEFCPDHGQSASFGVLFDSEFGSLYYKPIEELIRDIRGKLSESEWELLSSHLEDLGNETDQNALRKVFLIAVWAQLFSEPFGELWLAAMAQHAYFVEEDEYAFGYLIALLDQKQRNEIHFLRGRKTVRSAGLGGDIKAAASKANREIILTEMERLIRNEHSISRAAELTHKKGLGTSPSANLKMWKRHRKK
jgi:hypothetical protein